MIIRTYHDIEANDELAKLMDKVIEDCDVLVIARPGHEAVVMISMTEYEALTNPTRRV